MCQAVRLHTHHSQAEEQKKEKGGAYLVAAQRHFATAASAAAYVAVMANVANAIGELGLKANVTGGIQLDAGLLLLLGALSDLHLQCDNFVLLATAKREGGGGVKVCCICCPQLPLTALSRSVSPPPASAA